MSRKWRANLLVSWLVVGGSLLAADFGDARYGSVTISRPADELLRGRTLLVTSKASVPFTALPALTASVSQALSNDFSPTVSDPDLTLTFTVLAFEPVVAKNSSAMERRGVADPNYKGPRIAIPGMGTLGVVEKEVAVHYFEAAGRLTTQVTVTSRSGATLDSFTSKSEYIQKIETSVNGVQAKAALPSRQEMDSALLTKTAESIQKRYTRTTEPVKIRLATPDVLKTGLAYAERGQWQEALAEWTKAKAPKNEAERAYNMGVANEGLFYASDFGTDPSLGEPFLQEASRLYADAQRRDSKEKQFKAAADRVAAMEANLSRAKEQFAVLQREKDLFLATVASNASPTGAGAKSLADDELAREVASNRPDSADEADFRSNVKIRLRSRTEKPDAEYLSSLEKTATSSYKLKPIEAKRVIQQEVTSWEDNQHNAAEYRQMLKDLLGTDKTIDAGERDALSRFAARSQLTRDDVVKIETEFKFTDLTVQTPQAQPQTQQPRAPGATPGQTAPSRPPAASTPSPAKK